MSDPNDPRPLRVMIFPEKPHTILIHVPGGQPLWLPRIMTPFNLDALCKALDDHDIPHDTMEGDPGKWWRNASFLESTERAERAQEARVAVAQKMVRITTSPAATTPEKERAELILEQQKADAEIRALDVELRQARSMAYTSGVYMNPQTYREKEQRLADLRNVTIAIQVRVSELKTSIKAAHIARDEQRVTKKEQRRNARERRFIEKARRYLTVDQCREIWLEIDREDQARELEKTG